jgi:hypothetical protein
MILNGPHREAQDKIRGDIGSGLPQVALTLERLE